jgi:hypothetical protein
MKIVNYTTMQNTSMPEHLQIQRGWWVGLHPPNPISNLCIDVDYESSRLKKLSIQIWAKQLWIQI